MTHFVAYYRNPRGGYTPVVLLNRRSPAEPLMTDFETKCVVGAPQVVAPEHEEKSLAELAALYPPPRGEPR